MKCKNLLQNIGTIVIIDKDVQLWGNKIGVMLHHYRLAGQEVGDSLCKNCKGLHQSFAQIALLVDCINLIIGNQLHVYKKV